MNIKFKTYRSDGSEVIGTMTDLGKQIRGRRKLAWYVSEFDVDGKKFDSAVLARAVDRANNGLALRESYDVWALDRHGFSHIEVIEPCPTAV